MNRNAAEQLRMFGEAPQVILRSPPIRKRAAPVAESRSGRSWPQAWDGDRPAKIRALLGKEKWTVAETAFYFDSSDQHIVNSFRLVEPSGVHSAVDQGHIVAIDIARIPGSRPLYRIYRDSVLAFERARRVGAAQQHGGKHT